MPSRIQGMKDKRGLTEEEFLAAYSPKNYPQPSLTADICVFRQVAGSLKAEEQAEGQPVPAEGQSTQVANKLQLLLVERGGHPYLGCWATPGGFVSPGETADEAAARELAEETGVEGLALEPIALYSTPGRDPRGWTISYAFVALDEKGATVHAGDDAAKAQWFDVVASHDGNRFRLTLTADRGAATDAETDARAATRPDAGAAVKPNAEAKLGAGAETAGMTTEVLTTTFVPAPAPITGTPRATEVQGEGLAFDHAHIVADAWLRLGNR